MSKRRKNRSGPQKLTNFSASSSHGNFQDGGGRGDDTSGHPSSSSAPGATSESRYRALSSWILDGEELTPPNSSTTRCTHKIQVRRQEGAKSSQHEAGSTGTRTHGESVVSPKAAYPATYTPATENTIKAMLLSLHDTLHKDFSVMINPLRAKIQEQDQRIHYTEEKMAAMYTAHNDVVDSLQDHTR